ncbi:hypothetical protein BSK57_23470 [Paenibacillus odorifer]|nr:hypothetical protein BSK57_23470 [Paenibacillus odorifer]
MNSDIRELARVNVKAAMNKEYAENEKLIEEQIIKWTTSRHIKEIVFYLMARNQAIRAFLSLPENEQTIQALHHRTQSPSAEYLKLMRRLRATRYPLFIKEKAERALFKDYTHVDFKRATHFLDQTLPSAPEPNFIIVLLKRVFMLIGKVVELIFSLGWGIVWIGILVLVIVSYITDASSDTLRVKNSRIFSYGGISEGNSTTKLGADTPQIPDVSNKAGYGNPGVSGHDAPSSMKSSTSSTNSSGNETLSATNTENQTESDNSNYKNSKSNFITIGPLKDHLISATYFLPESDENEIFIINDGDIIELPNKEKVVIDFEITSESPPIFKLNNEILESYPTTKENVYWISFEPTDKETTVEVIIGVEIDRFIFNNLN